MTRWIAEAGSNWNGSKERLFALLEASAQAGFSDFKTQAFRLEKLFSPEALEAKPLLWDRLRYEIPWEWHKPLANRCKELGLQYGVTVFHRDHVRLCAQDADWLKASSYSLLDLPLLEALGSQPKPVVLSTGMGTEEEVFEATKALGMVDDLTLLHCTSAYPAPKHEANLRSIPFLHTAFGTDVGWSDHTCSMVVVGRAAAFYKASMIELHFDLGDSQGVEAGHSWDPGTVKLLRKALERGFSADDGYYACDGKKGVKAPSVSEEAERSWRADPSDGLRPTLAVRQRLLQPA